MYYWNDSTPNKSLYYYIARLVGFSPHPREIFCVIHRCIWPFVRGSTIIATKYWRMVSFFWIGFFFNVIIERMTIDGCPFSPSSFLVKLTTGLTKWFENSKGTFISSIQNINNILDIIDIHPSMDKKNIFIIFIPVQNGLCIRLRFIKWIKRFGMRNYKWNGLRKSNTEQMVNIMYA